MEYRRLARLPVMYHVTSTLNAKKIEKEGLKINQPSNYSQQWISDYYNGIIPIFLGYEPWGGRNGIVSGAIIKVNTTGLNLVADLPSICDFGAEVDDTNYRSGSSTGKESGLWWSEGDETQAGPLREFLDEEGCVETGVLLENLEAIEAAILLTGTAACLEDISVDKIMNIEYINNERIS
jgi:hypothetical protein